MQYKTPGVYIEEIQKFPPSIAAVETAIPVFIGYTEKALNERGEPLPNKPKRITSMLEYELFFGRAAIETGIQVIIQTVSANVFDVKAKIDNISRQPYRMYYALQHFFINGGGDCYVMSVGPYSADGEGVQLDALQRGLELTEQEDEITLILFPDAPSLPSAADYYGLYTEAIDKCVLMQDRFTIMDVWIDLADPIASNPDNLSSYIDTNIDTLRNADLPIETERLKYAAVYFPNLLTTLDYDYGAREKGNEGDGNVKIIRDGSETGSLADLKASSNLLYFRSRTAIRQLELELQPSPAMAGAYARVDRSRGVWKAPANVSIDSVVRPVVNVTNRKQENLNIDSVAGKSVNVIRSFVGRGPAIVWGARTLAGNDNEWRYVPVRRFFIFVEESVKNATVQFVFEPNDTNTWVRVKGMIDNFLVQQWRSGALMGSSPEQAFYVKVGLNETMTEEDIWEGYMIVEIGMAVVRPAEFIVLKFSHKRLSEVQA